MEYLGHQLCCTCVCDPFPAYQLPCPAACAANVALFISLDQWHHPACVLYKTLTYTTNNNDNDAIAG